MLLTVSQAPAPGDSSRQAEMLATSAHASAPPIRAPSSRVKGGTIARPGPDQRSDQENDP